MDWNVLALHLKRNRQNYIYQAFRRAFRFPTAFFSGIFFMFCLNASISSITSVLGFHDLLSLVSQDLSKRPATQGFIFD
jgi:hypothetical protein